MSSPGRNDPCPCGSGKKYKSCCMGKATASRAVATPPRPRAASGERLLREAMRHHQAGRLDQATRGYRQVLRAEPKQPMALFNLGQIQRQAGQPEQAIDLFRRAIKADGKKARFHSLLAACLLETGRSEESLKALDRAIAIDPRDAELYCTAAQCLERMNRLDEAEETIRRGLDMAPDDPHANLVLAGLLRRRKASDEARKRLEQLVAREDLPAHLRQRAYNQLGFVLDGAGESDAAFDAFCRSGQAALDSPEGRRIDPSRLRHRIDRYRAGLTRATLERLADAPRGDDRPAPAFLVGFPRSGTTLTEQVIAAHPGVVTTDERPIVSALRRALFEHTTGFDPEDTAGQLAVLDPGDVAALRQAYWTEAEKDVDAGIRDKTFLDKLPLNLIDLGLINGVFPDARVIVALRDPRDVCLSCFMQDFGLNQAMINFVSLEKTVAFYAEVMQLYLGIRNRLTLPLIQVRYEDTVTDLEPQARRLLEHLGLAWDESVLRFDEKARERAISTPSYAAVTEKVHTRAVARWKRYEEPFAPLQATLRPYLEAFGYDGGS